MIATASASAVAPAAIAPGRSASPAPRRASATISPNPSAQPNTSATRIRRYDAIALRASRLTRAMTRGEPAPSRATETAASRSTRWTSTRRRTGARTPPKRTPQSTSGT